MLMPMLKNNVLSFLIMPFLLVFFWGIYYILSSFVTVFLLNRLLSIKSIKFHDLCRSGFMSFFIAMPIMQAKYQSTALLFAIDIRSLFLFSCFGIIAQFFLLSFLMKNKTKEIFVASLLMHVSSFWLTYLFYYGIPYTSTVIYNTIWQCVEII